LARFESGPGSASARRPERVLLDHRTATAIIAATEAIPPPSRCGIRRLRFQGEEHLLKLGKPIVGKRRQIRALR
jgi:hypothetical protein